MHFFLPKFYIFVPTTNKQTNNERTKKLEE
jgi:hypothetical protein